MKAKITKRSVDSAKPGPRDVFLWDTEVRGFGCKVTPKGTRMFILQYWSHGRTRRVTLGRYGSDITADEARAMPLLAAYADHYLADHAKVKKKPSSYAADKRNLRKHIKPVLGRLPVDRITRADVARLHWARRRWKFCPGFRESRATHMCYRGRRKVSTSSDCGRAG